MDSTLIYQKRINLAIDFLSLHYAEPVSLARAADAAGFSPYHFHRLFTAIVGETPADYLQRIRLEMAANLLLKSNQSVARIACDCGFSSPAVFTRVFGRVYGITPGAYRAAGVNRLPDRTVNPLTTVSADFSLKPVGVMDLDETRVFYVASYEGYRIDAICNAWEKLTRWLALRGWITAKARAFGVSLDDPSLTRPNHCRYYACLTVPPGASPCQPVAEMRLPAGKYATFEATCHGEEISAVYASIYRDWLPASGLEPARSFPFEEYIITPDRHPRGLYELLAYIPVNPL